ncbi:MAG: hypothetical protein SNJ54_02885 [Anaerolineae bacterium]
MPASPKQVEEETIRLYETPAVREDLDDDDAAVLLTWAEGQIKRLAQEDGDFAQKNRFLRQLLARINTLVGQRPYVDAAGEQHYLDALMKVLPMNGYTLTAEQVLACLPDDRANVRANLTALLDLLNRDLPPQLVPPPTSAELPPPRTWLEAALRYHAQPPDASNATTGDPS